MSSFFDHNLSELRCDVVGFHRHGTSRTNEESQPLDCDQVFIQARFTPSASHYTDEEEELQVSSRGMMGRRPSARDSPEDEQGWTDGRTVGGEEASGDHMRWTTVKRRPYLRTSSSLIFGTQFSSSLSSQRPTMSWMEM